MSQPEVHERAGALRRQRVPFVHARVVRAERPTSVKPGDEAARTPEEVALSILAEIVASRPKPPGRPGAAAPEPASTA